MRLYFLDTSVCVGILRGRADDADLPLRDDCALSSITAAELWAGAEKAEYREKSFQEVEVFTRLFSLFPFDEDAARHYGEIRADLERRGTPIGPLDQLIAAHARSVGAMLITANVREFQRVPGLKCVAWKT